MKTINYLLPIITCIFLFFNTQAQTNISGIINSYIDVTHVDSANNYVTVSSASGFSVGEKILLIQMQGASIDKSQSVDYGTILNYNNSGNYEFQTICNIQGNNIYFIHNMLHDYDAADAVQLITVPVYNNVLINNGDLTSSPWNGTTGGVLVLEVTGTLDFGVQNIDVTGKGFRGGAVIQLVLM